MKSSPISADFSSLPLPTLTEVDRELRRRERRRCEASLAAFIRSSWHVLEPGAELLWNWHVDAIADHVQAVLEDWICRQKDASFVQRARNLLINVPPGTAKSRIVSVCAPAWMWLRYPSWRAIALSSNPRVALRDATYCRDVITSRWYQETFEPDWTLKEDQDAKGLYANTRGGFRQSQGITARITGDRADAIFVDDPHDAEEVNSEAERLKVLDRWDHAAANRVNDLRTSVRIGIMQRLHADDWAGHVLAQGGWRHLRLPMLYEPKPSCGCGDCQKGESFIGWKDPRTEADEVLHKERFPPDVLAGERRTLGSAGWAGQMQQNPRAAGGNIFQESWFRRWRRTELPPGWDELLLSVDANFKDRESSKTPKGPDWVVIQGWGRSRARKFLLAQRRGQWGFPETLAQLVEMRELMLREFGDKAGFEGTVQVLVEAKANGPAIISTLRESVEGMIGYEPEGSKEARAHAVAPGVEAGDVSIPAEEEAPWAADFLLELTHFPRWPNDDQVDAMTQALRRLSGADAKPPKVVQPQLQEIERSRWLAGKGDM